MTCHRTEGENFLFWEHYSDFKEYDAGDLVRADRNEKLNSIGDKQFRKVRSVT